MWHAYRSNIYASCVRSLRSYALPFSRTGPKSAKKPKIWPLSGLHWLIYRRPRLQNNRHGVLPHMNPHTKFERRKANIFWVIAWRRKSVRCDRAESKVSPALSGDIIKCYKGQIRIRIVCWQHIFCQAMAIIHGFKIKKKLKIKTRIKPQNW